MKQLVLVLGTGRSGTHLLGRTIASHPAIDGHIEDPRYFRLATKIATRQDVEWPPLTAVRRWQLIRRYRRLLRDSPGDHILDKTHPNIWLAEWLARRLPTARFVGIIRDVLPTVSSMLLHEGVMEWYRRLPQDRPNRFLGITAANRAEFAALPPEGKCALRWLAHKRELERLRDVLGREQYRLFRYESFVEDLDPHLAELAAFIGVDRRFQPEPIRAESLDKWRANLSDEQVARVREALARFGGETDAR